MTEQDNSKNYQDASRDLTRELIITAPLYLLVPVLFAALALIWVRKSFSTSSAAQPVLTPTRWWW